MKTIKTKQFRLLILPALLCFALLSSSVHAQLQQTSRFEEEQKNTDHDYYVISMHEEGIALVRDNEKYEDGKKIWEIILLDTILQKSWSGKIPLENRNQFIGYEYVQQSLYLLFRNGEVNTNNMHLIHLSLATHETKNYEIKHEFDFRLTHFSMTGTTAVFGGYVVREPAVLLFSTQEKQMKVVPGFFLNDTELLDLRINNNNTFNVLMTERGNKEDKRLIVRTYDESGALLLDDVITIERDINLLSGITSSLVRDEMIVIGTYAIGLGKQATGFYSVLVDPFSEQPIRYTDLAQFNHLLDYLGDKRASKVKNNAQHQRQKGKPPAFKSNIALVRIQEVPKGFLLLAEVYNASSAAGSSGYWNNTAAYGFGNGYSPYGPYPFNNNRYYNTPYSYNNPIQNTDVKMIEGVLVLFDKEGKPDWDESLEFDDLKYPSLEQVSDFYDSGQGLIMVYKKESELFSKNTKIHDGNFEMDTTVIKLKQPTEIIRNESETDGGLRHWYKKYFYTWGYQSIKDTSRRTDDPNRNVFYINKVEVE